MKNIYVKIQSGVVVQIRDESIKFIYWMSTKNIIKILVYNKDIRGHIEFELLCD